MRKPVRRVVTGHDDAGRAVILSDTDAPNSFMSNVVPGFGATVPWFTNSTEIDFAVDDDPATADAEIPSFPTPGQTIFRIADFPPDSAYPEGAGEAIFSEIDGSDAQEAGNIHSGGRHFWFHRTDSLDYAIVLEGEITLLVDEGEVTLTSGDVVIQRATSHAWSNRTDENARVAFVLIGTVPITADEIAAQRQRISGRV